MVKDMFIGRIISFVYWEDYKFFLDINLQMI